MQTLRNAGYCWVSMPDSYIAPLQLLKKGSNGEVNQLNTSIETIFTPNTFSLPTISPDIELTSQISGDELIDLKIQTDVSILQSLLKIFSKNAAAGFSMENKNTGKLNLIDAKRNFIDIGKLDAFIGDADMVTAARTLITNLKDDELYVITEIIKTKGFSLETSADKNFDTHLNAGTTVADVDASVKKDNTSSNILKQEGDTYITVAIKAYRIYYDKPGFFSGSPAGFHIKQEDIKTFRGEEDFPGTPLATGVIVN